jgi:hypothetical protein
MRENFEWADFQQIYFSNGGRLKSRKKFVFVLSAFKLVETRERGKA